MEALRMSQERSQEISRDSKSRDAVRSVSGPAGSDGAAASAGAPLEVCGLCYAYPDGHRALNGVSFALGRGEKLALVGPNGSGKSTLMLHLAGCIAAQTGTVSLEGVPVGKDLKRLREAVGLIFQDPDDQLFMPQVVEDVAFGPVAHGMPVEEARARALEVLESLNVGRLAERPPHRLSGGEKRMAALAGILVMRPEIVVLDEPSAALDPRARRRVIEVLQELDKSLILATHDLDMALDVCGRAIVLYEGRIAADGDLGTILGDEALLRRNGLELPLRCSVLSEAR